MKNIMKYINLREEEFIPEPDNIICKYMDFPKFLSLLQYRKLHFTRADRFKDELEGKIPECIVDGFECKNFHNKFDIYRKRTFINCWSRFDNESYAMWHIYSKKYGIAIETTVNKLQKSLEHAGAVVRKVKYVDCSNKNAMIKISHLNCDDEKFKICNFFMLKPKFYEFEREIRAIITQDEEEPFKEVEIDISYLIDEIIISPFANKWFNKLIRDIVHKQYGLSSIKIQGSDVEINR